MISAIRSTSCGARPSDGSSSSSSFGSRHQRAADREHLLLAAGQQPGALLRGAPQAREELEDALARRGLRCAPPRPNAPARRFSSTVRSREDPPALGHLRRCRRARSSAGSHAAMPRAGERRSMPPSTVPPLERAACPEIARSSVDLPAPLLPSTATISPSATVSEDAPQRAHPAVGDVQLGPTSSSTLLEQRPIGAWACAGHDAIAHQRLHAWKSCPPAGVPGGAPDYFGGVSEAGPDAIARAHARSRHMTHLRCGATPPSIAGQKHAAPPHPHRRRHDRAHAQRQVLPRLRGLQCARSIRSGVPFVERISTTDVSCDVGHDVARESIRRYQDAGKPIAARSARRSRPSRSRAVRGRRHGWFTCQAAAMPRLEPRTATSRTSWLPHGARAWSRCCCS